MPSQSNVYLCYPEIDMQTIYLVLLNLHSASLAPPPPPPFTTALTNPRTLRCLKTLRILKTLDLSMHSHILQFIK